MKKIIINLNLLFLFLFTNLSLIQAANEITVSPVNYYLKVAAGVPQILPYTLTNDTNQDLKVSLTVKSFVPNEKGIPQLQTETDFPFLSLPEATATGEIILPAGATKKVAVLIDTPLGITEKEYPLTVLFVLEPKAVEAQASLVKINLGSNLIILVGENNADLSRLQIVEPRLPRIIDSWQTLNLNLKGKNNGQMGTLMTGEVILRRKDGTLVKQEEIYPDLILAQAIRELRYKLEPDSQGKTVITTIWTWPKFLFGEYILQVRLRSQVAKTSSSDVYWQTKLWFFPYWISIAFLLLTVMVIGVKVLYNKRRPKVKRELQKKLDLMKKQEKFFKNN